MATPRLSDVHAFWWHGGSNRLEESPVSGSRPDIAPKPLDLIDAAFRELIDSNHPLVFDGSAIGADVLPSAVRLDELQAILRERTTPYALSEEVWSEVARCAKSGDERWVVALAGLLLPGLRRVAGRVVRDYAGCDPTDIDSEVIIGLLEALRTVDASTGRIPARLCWAAYRRARRAWFAEHEEARRRREGIDPQAPPLAPPAHPDLVLADAVRAGVLSRADAELIGTTRLDGLALPALARRLDISADTLRHRRHRAERRLVQWLGRRSDTSLSCLGRKIGSVECGPPRGVTAHPGGHRLRTGLAGHKEGGDDATSRAPCSSGSRPAPASTTPRRSPS
jgi:DNA-directed RNA polymerase specialized sigma24 family protein